MSSLASVSLEAASLLALDSYFIFYSSVVATAVVVNLATFAYFFRTTWLLQWSLRQAAYYTGGLELKSLLIEKVNFSYFDRNPGLKENGDDPETVVMFHGFSSSKGPMMGLAHWFPKSWRIIIPDLPAHGDTTYIPGGDYSQKGIVQQIHKFIVKLGLKKYHLVGESMGGVLCLKYASTYKEEIKTLSALCPPLEDAKRSEFFTHYEDVGRNMILPENVEEFEQMLDLVYYKKPKVLPRRILQAFLEIQKPKYKAFDEVFFQMILSRPSPDELYDSLKKINFPTKIIWGKHDKVSDVTGGEILNYIIEGSEFEVVDRCGHALTLERPRKTANIICNFIQKNITC